MLWPERVYFQCPPHGTDQVGKAVLLDEPAEPLDPAIERRLVVQFGWAPLEAEEQEGELFGFRYHPGRCRAKYR